MSGSEYKYDADETIVKRYYFQILLWLSSFVLAFFDFSFEGLDKVPKSEGVLFVSPHSSHNQDIPLFALALYKASGKLIRGLVHRIVMKMNPIAYYIGCIPGHRGPAIKLLKEGHWVGVIPGGGEEAIMGYENGYKLHWKSSSGRRRLGFAHVARDAGVKIVPVAAKNVQEMFFNPVTFIWNRLGLSRAYSKYLITLPGIFGWFFFQLAMYVWICVGSFCIIPLPVKVTTVFGDPLQCEENESIEEFAQRVESTLQNLIDKLNPGGVNYTRALRERFSHDSKKKIQ